MRDAVLGKRTMAAIAVVCLTGTLVAVHLWSGPSPTVGPSPIPSTRVSASPSPSPVPSPTPSPTPSSSPSFDREALSIDDPASVWVIVNKTRPLDPIDYTPTDLSDLTGVYGGSWQYLKAEAAAAFVAMADAAKAEGITIRVATAYRSYGDQRVIYRRWVNEKGKWWADQSSARGGYSEHQTGLAVDIYDSDECRLQFCFGRSSAGTWVAEHAWEYGFILRYPEGSEEITGFIWEPWHLRYVGIELATEMHETGVATLEEFFGLPAAPDYL